MLIGIEGGLGDGKTILMVRYLVKDSLKGYSLYPNLKLFNGVKYTPLDVVEMLKYEKENVSLMNATIGVDEITVFLDCRLSMTKLNRIFSYFILQSRKRSVDIYYTSQDLTMCDKRLLKHTHIQILAESLYDEHNTVIPHFKKYTLFDFRNVRKPHIERFILDIRPYYEYYNTDEVILPPM
jgi:hypothetical protein